MAEYKKQHYLPAAYLKQFSPDGPKATRKSSVWRTDKKRSILVPVESQCAADYHYSRQSANETEKFFQQGELLYDQIAKTLWMERQPSHREYFGLILLMFDIHLRSSSYENKTGEENYRAYLRRQAYLRGSVLSKDPNSPTSIEESADFLAEFWRVAVLRVPARGELVTSDNPSIWCNWQETDSPDCVILPLLPGMCGIAFDARTCRISSDLTPDDVARLNNWQIQHCSECIYSRSQLDKEEIESVQNTLTPTPRSAGYTDTKSWNMRRVGLGGDPIFSFLCKS